MSAITPHCRNVQQLLQSPSCFIDEYQRQYNRANENIDELLSDLQVTFYCYNRFTEGAVNAGVTALVRRSANDQSMRAHSSDA